MREITGEERADNLMARLAVIESKLETLIDEIMTIRKHIPSKMVEHAERIAVLERNVRTVQWLAGVFAVAIIGAFVAHVFAR